MPPAGCAKDSLMERILERNNVLSAWQRVQSNKGAPGSDGMTLEDFPAYARDHWPEIHQSLMDDRYQPRPVRQVVILKPHDKGERKLGVPCVLDRVIQQARTCEKAGINSHGDFYIITQ
jgi:RNA-directed DNA polymerase